MSFGSHQQTVDGANPAAGTTQHAVQFYEAPEFLCDVVARFAAEGLTGEQNVVLIPTSEHAASLSAQLAARIPDLDNVLRLGRLRILDADETLAEFMRGPVLDEQLCSVTLSAIIEESQATQGSALPIRIFGEMVDVLWQAGNPAAAVRLEQEWNELGRRHPFSLLCAYALGNFSHSVHTHSFDELCGCHTHVLPTEQYISADDDARAREVSRLQQRARALEAEIEHRKVAEHALLRAKEEAERANRAKSDFLAIMSHELRTPLNAIFGYEDLLNQGVAGPVTPQQSIYLDRIRNSATHLLQLIDQVLHLARIEAGVEEVAADLVDLGEITREAVESVQPGATQKGIGLSVESPTEPLRISTDRGKLRQILLNLLSNAVKFTHAGEIRLAVRRNHSFVHVHVSDTGIGIEPVEFQKVFEPFVQVDASSTRQYGGSGLGLSVSRNLARLLGGDITVTSAPEQGSTFTLSLPLNASAVTDS